MEQRPATRPEPALRLGLALQGGGLHGAFGWGVLHELLEDETIEISALSGTSAGAINAVVLADGWLARPADPRRGAQDALARFWHLNVLASAALSGGVLRPSLWDALAPRSHPQAQPVLPVCRPWSAPST